MSLEIEAKFKYEEHDALRDRLEAQQAKRLGTVIEKNRIFDSGQRLRESGIGLRVREAMSITGHGQLSTLTFKGPLQSGKLKIRPEHEVKLSNADSAAAILAGLGFEPFVVFEKIRESWSLGSCQIELDELPRIGKFVEVEGPSEQDVQHCLQQLGLQDQPHLQQSYLGLLLTVSRTMKLPVDQILFEDSHPAKQQNA